MAGVTGPGLLAGTCELVPAASTHNSPVQFGHDDVLCLVGCGAGGEVDHVGQPPAGEGWQLLGSQLHAGRSKTTHIHIVSDA